MCQSDKAIIWIILEQDCTHIAFDATYGFNWQTDLHCKGVRTQSLVELRGSWEWVWLSQRSPWSSAQCYFCENTERDERKHEEDWKKNRRRKKRGCHDLQRSCHVPMRQIYSMRHLSLCCGKCACNLLIEYILFWQFLCQQISVSKSPNSRKWEKEKKNRKTENRQNKKYQPFCWTLKTFQLIYTSFIYSERL